MFKLSRAIFLSLNECLNHLKMPYNCQGLIVKSGPVQLSVWQGSSQQRNSSLRDLFEVYTVYLANYREIIRHSNLEYSKIYNGLFSIFRDRNVHVKTQERLKV